MPLRPGLVVFLPSPPPRLRILGHDRLNRLNTYLLGGENPQPSGIGDLPAGVVVLGYSAHKVAPGNFQTVAELGKIGGPKRFTNRRLKWNFVV